MRYVFVIATLIVAVIAILMGYSAYLDEGTAKRSENVAAKVDTFHLSNGIKVIVLPNHRVPAISHTMWVRVGAADDPMGKSGLAHYLEHLMFQGTPTVPAGEFSKKIEKLGGQHNAFTGADFTGYYVNIAKEHLPKVMELEADRFQHLALGEEEWQKEREVILEERRSRIDNNPSALLAEQMNAVQFFHHPYRIPIIGWKHEMESLTKNDAESFYDDRYHAGNLFLVVAGDITAENLKPLAEKYYGGLPVKPAVERDWVKEPKHLSPRILSLRSDQVKQTQWIRQYTAPSLVHGDTKLALPLMFLAYWLGGGESSLLYQSLVVEQGKAVSANANYSALRRGPSIFDISVVPAPDVTSKELSRSVREVLHHVRTEKIDSATLNRIKTLLKAEAIYARDGLEKIAMFVGYLEAVGADISYYTEWTNQIDAVTDEQILEAAQQILIADESVTGLLLPQAAKKELKNAQ